MRRLVLLAVLVATTACEVGTFGTERDSRRLESPRWDIAPGQTIDVPVVVDATGRGTIELAITAIVSSHDGELDVLPRLDLEPARGEVTTDPEEPLIVRCDGACVGRHIVTMALSEVARTPVTIQLVVHARRDGRGLSVAIEESAEPSSWDVYSPTFTAGRQSDSGRLHITSPVGAQGGIRLEVPAAGTEVETEAMIVATSERVEELMPGGSFAITQPDGVCDEYWCDWSVAVATVKPWLVAVDSEEYHITYSEADGLATGEASWIDTVSGGEIVDLRLEVETDAAPGTAVSIRPRISFLSEYAGRPPDGLSVSIGGREVVPTRTFVEASNILLDLACGVGECRGGTLVTIDATAIDRDVEMQIVMGATRSHLTSIERDLQVTLEEDS